MATKVNPLRPFIFKFNQAALDAFEEQTEEAQTNYLTANRYFYFAVWEAESGSSHSLDSALYTGKTWCYLNDDGEPEISIDIASIVKSYMYKSNISLEPHDWNEELQQMLPVYSENNSAVKAVCSQANKDKFCFGRTKFTVGIFAYTDDIGRWSSRMMYLEKEVTSSSNINDNILGEDDSYTMQNILNLEFPGFVSRYPKVLTDNFSVSWLINTKIGENSQADRRTLNFGNNVSEYFTVQVEYGQTGYVPVNIKLSDIIPYLAEVTSDPIPFENIVGARSSQTVYNIFRTGTSVEYTPANTWYGGNSSPHNPPVEGVNKTNEIFQWIGTTAGRGMNHIAHLDECYSKYYLKWMTKSCVPVCWGFDGNTTNSHKYTQEIMQDVYRTDVIKTVKDVTKWELKSGLVDKLTYSAFEDIFTSPYLILYSTETDTSWYVKVTDSTWDKKENVWTDRKPLSLNINIETVQERKFVY